ncbi:MAG: CDP-diacylglycerol--serine O-phosphatidyltransferase [Candidatus Schekmanbacteria bacterium RBG_13_48_7]|uniref:CDP-diacylglycerol--serine O-phosphatidyltransferase n=1 Tax=Candidatus Schekmanbacteria bacterium RBG_13_48_7 TaxID=1817878 RepID=A0A1F7S4B8_9BACT|nr:MAG: CDP-diacylglycerol--serine O-phosphatidyltransferase [Candidatus Schekmanbacteria bacterium RBG_13_48_7]
MDNPEDSSEKKISRFKPRRIKKFSTKRGAFLLPSLLTTGNMFCGFVAIIYIINSFVNLYQKEYFLEIAAILILVAIFLDALDGRVARLTNTASSFGLQYDSLSDLVSFGVAPGLLIYAYALTPFKRFGWLAAFLFLICGAMRLARFNITTSTLDKKYSMGLPIPVASGLLASLVLIDPKPVKHFTLYSIGVLALLYLLSYLMVSKIRYRTFKELDFRERKSTRMVVILAILFLIFATHEITIVITGFLYILSGPFAKLFIKPKSNATDSDHASSSGNS